ncbi:MAG: family 2 glycosyl transferase, partial [Frankiales bacterium]|nr:family 2 glycosyl transferase [Frankiales bacterium]
KRLTTSRRLRVWAGVAYALSPPVVGAVAGGRIDAVIGLVLLPVAAGSVVRALRPGAESRRTWVAAVAVSLAVAATPILYAVVLLLVGVLVAGGLIGGLVRLWRVPLRAIGRSFLLAVVPLLVLAPWSVAALRHPVLAVRGAGPVVADAALGAPRVLQLLLGLPGGAGAPPMFTYLPIVVAAIAALGSERRRRFVGAAWCAALGALAVAVAVTRFTPVASDTQTSWRVWTGVPVALVLGLLIAATARAAQGARTRFRGESFGWRQPALAVVAVAAVAAPVFAAGWLLLHPANTVQRGRPAALPPYVANDIGGPAGTRALLLRPSGDQVDYTVLEGPVHTLTETDVPLPGARQAQLTSLVRQLTAGPSDDIGFLTAHAIGYVVLLQPDERIATALDSQPGITRNPQRQQMAVWSVTPLPSRVSILTPGDAALALSGSPPQPGRLAALPVPGPYGAAHLIPAGAAGRLLLLAETADRGWVARLDGRRLPAATAFGTQQAFALPAEGGALLVRYEAPASDVGRWVALGSLLVLLVLAAPPVRLREDVPGEPDDFSDQPLALVGGAV